MNHNFLVFQLDRTHFSQNQLHLGDKEMGTAILCKKNCSQVAVFIHMRAASCLVHILSHANNEICNIVSFAWIFGHCVQYLIPWETSYLQCKLMPSIARLKGVHISYCDLNSQNYPTTQNWLVWIRTKTSYIHYTFATWNTCRKKNYYTCNESQ